MARKWAVGVVAGDRPLIFATATRPIAGETVNGDTWHVTWADGGCRLAVVDGLGHGPAAAEAAAVAVRALAAHPGLGALPSLQLLHAEVGWHPWRRRRRGPFQYRRGTMS